MKFEVSEKFFKEYPQLDLYVVLVQDINNVTSKSRDINLSLQEAQKNLKGQSKLKGLDILENSFYNNFLQKVTKGEKLPNLNPLVNYFNTFLLEKKAFGLYADLRNIYGDIQLGQLEKEMPFVEQGQREILTCKTGEWVLKDAHSVTHRVVSNRQGERVRVDNSSKDCILIFGHINTNKNRGKGVFQQNIREFANSGKVMFGGVWKVYELGETTNQIEIEYESKVLSGDIEIEVELENLIQGQIEGKKGIQKRREKTLNLINKQTLLGELNTMLKGFLDVVYPELDLGKRSVIFTSPNLSFGHFSSNICFELSKIKNQKVFDMANEVCMKLNSETRVSSVFNKIEVAKNGFLNFFLDEKFLLGKLQNSLEDFDAFSSSNIGKNRVILIESPSANPNKPLHVGHLLNIFLGKSLMSIFEKLGFDVYNDNLINDKGLPICKALWALNTLGKDATPESEGLKSDHFVGKYYVLGAEKFKESKEVEEEVREILRKWENGDTEVISLWKQMIDWVLAGHKDTMSRLGEEIGHMWFESDIYEEGKEMIRKAVDGVKVVQGRDGAIMAKLKDDYGVPDVVLVKSDGTSLYHTQDVYLTKLKVEKFHPWKAIWVVGNEQITHFQRLFSLIDMLGFLSIDNLYHLAYGYVFDKEGKKMSSRTGDALSGDELLDMVREAARKENDKTAESVSIGALKYAFLSSDPFKDMKFDIKRALTFNGKSGPYIMYSFARATNILKKVGQVNMEKVVDVNLNDLEKEIILKCMDYPNTIVASANNYSPSILADYLYDLAKLFNQMYETEKVLDSKGSEFVLRVSLVSLVQKILNDGLLLLRIKPLENM
jgi:arginyl-tRNA synthetase